MANNITSVKTINELRTLNKRTNYEFTTVLVTDKDEGGIFTYDSARFGEDDGVDVIDGWVRSDGFGAVGGQLAGLQATAAEIDGNTLKSKMSSIKIAFLGDSITAEALSSNNYRCRGYVIWVMELLKWNFTNVGIFGYPGYTTLQVYGQIQNVISADPDICIVLTGTNDMGSYTEVATIKTHYDSIINTLNYNKIIPVFLSVFPNNLQTEANNNRGIEFNKYLKLQQSLGKIFYIDIRDNIALTGSTIQSDKTYDGVHTSGYGAYSIATPIAQFLSDMFPSSKEYIDTSDNLFPNPYLTGTNGTIGANASGVAPTGFYVSASGTTPSVVSSITNRDALVSTKSLKIVFTGGNNDNTSSNILSLGYSCVATGKYILEADVDISGTGFINTSLRCQSFSGNIFRWDSKGDLEEKIVKPINGTLSYKMRTPIMSINASQVFNMYFDIRNGVGTCTYYLSNIKLIKVS